MSLFKPYNYKNRPENNNGALKKNRFFIFWEIFFRKFWRFVSLNVVYFLITLPILLYFYYTANGFFISYFGDGYADLLPGIGFIAAFTSGIPDALNIPILVVSVLLYGPLKMGMTYVYRNFTREEHAWFSDVWEKAKENWKQGVVLGVLDFLITLLLVNNIVGGFSAQSAGVGTLFLISRYLSIVLLVVFAFVRHYSYLIAVTVVLPIRAIIKNSLLFIVMGLGRNIISTAVCVLVWLLSLFTLPLASVVCLPLLTYALCGFVTVYVCYPTVKKYIIVPAMKLSQDNETEKTENE